MILIREVRHSDSSDLRRFGEIPGLYNLPTDERLLKEKIEQSTKSFLGKVKKPEERKFIFVAEDTELGLVKGTSMVASQYGTVERPHFSFKVDKEEKFSKTINTGFIHGTLELKIDTNGPSEIGGLVLDPEFRGSEEKIGRQISFVRFLFMGLHRDLFKEDVIAELLPPLDKNGRSPLWEAIGRRFTNMDYWEADALCQQNKEFVLSLFPRDRIYSTFLPAEARDAIGKVGKATQPVFHMLSKIGFEYANEVDPFDGGPHMRAKRDQLIPIQKIQKRKIAEIDPSLKEGVAGLISPIPTAKRKAFVSSQAYLRLEDADDVVLGGIDPSDLEQHLGLSKGSEFYFMPYY